MDRGWADEIPQRYLQLADLEQDQRPLRVIIRCRTRFISESLSSSGPEDRD